MNLRKEDYIMSNCELYGAAVVGQSGGPTSAINASLAGVIKACIEDKKHIDVLYGMENGIEGFLNEKLINLSGLFTLENGEADTQKLDLLSTTPASALGSCRKKLPTVDNTEFYDNLISLFKKHNIRYFFYIGGNDSMDTVAKLSSYLEKTDYEMRVIGVPKTIDNDLMETDHTPGYGSAAKYIATTLQEVIRDCSVYTTKAVTIVEIMGRDSGWLTCAAAIGRIVTGYEPDYVYLPEIPFNMESFFEDIENAFKKHPNVVIAVSEGANYGNGHYVGEGTQSGAVDVFGHKYLEGTGKALEIAVKEKFGCKVRSIELNLPQRCAAHLASKTDINESFCCGYTAVTAAANGLTAQMISMKRKASEEYSVEYLPISVYKVANEVKTVPKNFINDRGNQVTDECLEYILPLILGETEVIYEKGLPKQLIIR